MKLIALLAGLCLLVLQVNVWAVPAPVHIQAELTDARLAGQGTYRWFGLKIYDASLWVTPEGYQPDSVKFALNLRYARELFGERIAQASIDEIKQLKMGTPAQQETWLVKMKALFPDVQEGSEICGIYLPQQGARFYLNGKLLGEINDAEFARAFFAIWLDPRSSADKLRRQLLGLHS